MISDRILVTLLAYCVKYITLVEKLMLNNMVKRLVYLP